MTVPAVAGPQLMWTYFQEFVDNEKAVGGPDPHLKMVVHMSRNESTMERIWRGGCYVGAYNVPGAELIWQAWPWPSIVVASQEQVVDWAQSVWPIPTRRERRSVRTPEQMGRYLWDYGRWATNFPARDVGHWDYEDAWAFAGAVYTMGRYVRIKLLEYLRESDIAPSLVMTDIRPRDGWSPREGLALLYPQYEGPLLGGDSPEELGIVNLLADRVRGAAGLTMFETQVFLCEFKASWSSKRQYPGRSHDSELEYYRKADRRESSDFLAVRRELFPERALGEIAGWEGPRKELGHVLRDHGYTWSDLIYNYRATTDLSKPVLWTADQPWPA